MLSVNPVQLISEQEQEIHDLLSQGQKIQAIAKVQQWTKAGLKNSKDYVDQLAEKNH